MAVEPLDARTGLREDQSYSLHMTLTSVYFGVAVGLLAYSTSSVVEGFLKTGICLKSVTAILYLTIVMVNAFKVLRNYTLFFLWFPSDTLLEYYLDGGHALAGYFMILAVGHSSLFWGAAVLVYAFNVGKSVYTHRCRLHERPSTGPILKYWIHLGSIYLLLCSMALLLSFASSFAPVLLGLIFLILAVWEAAKISIREFGLRRSLCKKG